jgi:hypothetical protein
MSKFIKLNKITGTNTSASRINRYNDNEEGEGPVAETVVPEIQSTPVVINVDALRCFYTRKCGNPGTRLTFTDGGGFAVTELFDEVDGMVEAAMAPATSSNGSRRRQAPAAPAGSTEESAAS